MRTKRSGPIAEFLQNANACSSPNARAFAFFFLSKDWRRACVARQPSSAHLVLIQSKTASPSFSASEALTVAGDARAAVKRRRASSDALSADGNNAAVRRVDDRRVVAVVAAAAAAALSSICSNEFISRPTRSSTVEPRIASLSVQWVGEQFKSEK